MTTRLLLPNRSADARWGYLDKYEVNPQLARAFLASMLLVLTALAVSRFAVHGMVTLQVVPNVFGEAVNVLPAPQFESPAPRPHVASHLRVEPVLVRPVLAPLPDDAWDPGAPPSPGGTDDAPGLAATEDAGDAVWPGSGAVLQWPDPDTFIPVEHEPVLVSIPAPAYPELAREAGIEGTVYVRVLVGEDGFVYNALILQSVLGLDEAALAAARGAVFRAALQQERPVAVWIVVPIEFRLHG